MISLKKTKGQGFLIETIPANLMVEGGLAFRHGVGVDRLEAVAEEITEQQENQESTRKPDQEQESPGHPLTETVKAVVDQENILKRIKTSPPGMKKGKRKKRNEQRDHTGRKRKQGMRSLLRFEKVLLRSPARDPPKEKRRELLSKDKIRKKHW